MRMLTDLLNDDFGSPKKGTYPLPCQVIENLMYDYTEESGIDSRPESRFMILVNFPNVKYREITHVQEYDVESLVGDVGGYIGLFLGYTLLHFPTFVISMFHVIKKKIVPGVQEVRRNRLRSKWITTTVRKEIQARRDAGSTIIKNYDNTAMGDVKRQLNAIRIRIDEMETQVSIVEEISNCKKSKRSSDFNRNRVSSNNSLQKLRVVECKECKNTPDFI